jgi:hypothetical protein
MESTGIFWRPVFNILEGTVTILLANARHMKQLPGRKTDINDAQWIARLLRWGLLKPSLIPTKPIRELREMCRYRKKLTQEVAAEKNRVHKTLEDANIKIASVATEIFGVSGLAMMDALIAGDLSPQDTAELARGRMRSKIPELTEALAGKVEEYHRLLLRKHLDHLSYLQQAIAEMNRLIEEKIKPNTRMLWLETPSNPLLNIVDLEMAVGVAKRHNLLTAIDNTFATPYFLRPIEYGVDLVVHSTTMYLNGHCDVVGGAVVTTTDELSQKDIPAYVEEDTVDAKASYRVKVGKLKTRQEALDLQKQLTLKGYSTKICP